jgi:hypothetical protein
MELSTLQRNVIFGLLIALLAATRPQHFAPLPDATLAVFFLAGLYVGRTRLMLPLLLGACVLADYASATVRGDNFWTQHCVTLAYWLIVPAYSSMWIGGRWFSRHLRSNARSLPLALVAVLAAFSVSFLFSNGGYYTLSGRYSPSWSEFVTRFVHYYPQYLLNALTYVGIAALVHVAIVVTRHSARQPAGSKT